MLVGGVGRQQERRYPPWLQRFGRRRRRIFMALLFCLGDFLRLRALALLLASPPRRNHYSFRGIYPGIFRPHVRVSVEIPAKWNNFSTRRTWYKSYGDEDIIRGGKQLSCIFAHICSTWSFFASDPSLISGFFWSWSRSRWNLGWIFRMEYSIDLLGIYPCFKLRKDRSS